uniref:Protein yippee-like 3 isoform X2 n=1 Tax=Sus scrofa TaxID=9823 RepID=A0A480HLK6_PIG
MPSSQGFVHCFIMYKRYRTRGADTRGVRGARWEEKFTGQMAHWGQESSTQAMSIGQAGQEGVKNEIQASQIAGRCGGVVHLVHLLNSHQGHSACNKIYVQDPSSAGALRSRAPFGWRQARGAPWRPGRAGATGVRSQGQSQPLSLIMWLSSMMYFPSLYFWLLSKACSYFQPKVVLQFSQWMSATAWRPVSSTRSSAGPQPTFTTELKR